MSHRILLGTSAIMRDPSSHLPLSYCLDHAFNIQYVGISLEPNTIWFNYPSNNCNIRFTPIFILILITYFHLHSSNMFKPSFLKDDPFQTHVVLSSSFFCEFSYKMKIDNPLSGGGWYLAHACILNLMTGGVILN